MKKVIIFILVAAFVSACSQYTCPTYTKQESKNPTSERNV